MATKRMFSKIVIGSDSFLDLPTASQALYIHLCMHADDDGFIGNIKRIVNSLSISTEDELKLLFLKGYLIMFPSGVVVISHWKIHNTIRKERYNPTVYQHELGMLKMNKAKQYYLDLDSKSNVIPNVTHNVIPNVTQVGTTDIGIDIDIDKDSVCTEEKHTQKYFDNEDLNKAFINFIAMRRQMNRPMMDLSIQMMIGKLSSLSGNDEEKMIAILQQAILRGTPDIYPLDGDLKKKKQQDKFRNFSERDTDYDALQKELER